METAKEHQLKVARKTLKMPGALLGVLGGMTKEQAREIVKEHEGGSDSALKR